MTTSEIGAYLDGEMDATRAVAFEEHLEVCAPCRAAVEEGRALSQALRRAPYHTAPASLAGRVVAGPSAQSGRMWMRRVAAAAAVALVVGATALVAERAGRRSAIRELVVRDVIAAHVRSMMTGHLADVLSSDQHTVKPWFQGRVPFSPPAVDFSAEGFPLVGGRLDYLDGHAAAVLIYQRRAHRISVFIWPAGAPDSEFTRSRDGFEAVHWTHAGLAYWAVSDVAPSDLEELAQLLRGTAPGEPAPSRGETRPDR